MSRPTAKTLTAMLAIPLAASAAGASLRAVDATPVFAIAQSSAVIPSTDEDALDRPPSWNCTRIRPEYHRWLKEGNSPESWKYVGKTYRDVETNETYDWQDWLDWADEAGCVPGAARSIANGVPSANSAIGGAISALGVGLLTATGGSNAKSPG